MNEKVKKRIYYAIGLSVVIHSGFLLWSYFVKMAVITDKPMLSQDFIHVQVLKSAEEAMSAPSKKEKLAETLRPENSTGRPQSVSAPRKASENVQRQLLSAVNNQEQVNLPIIRESAEFSSAPKRSDVSVTQKAIKMTRRDLVEIGEIPKGDANPSMVSSINSNELGKGSVSTVNFTVKSPVLVASARVLNPFELMKKATVGIEKNLPVTELKEVLTFELSTYKDPRTLEKYFKLIIKVKDATINYPIIPKEIIFLVDASNSIGQQRFEEFQQGLANSLKKLNPEDMFNVIVFKDRLIPYSPESLSPDVDNIRKAVNFLKTLKAGSRTDVYGALTETLNLDKNLSPSYRVLLSDGFPTKGVTDDRQVINQISDINKGKISIFSFGGGVSISRYMMDFLSYKNRGWSHYTKKDYQIGDEVFKLYNKIKDPMLLNLRYHLSGISQEEVFPQILSDFFKGSEFVIYGNYSDEDNFVVELLGNIRGGETKEYELNASLKKARAGNREIARQWAFHKVYHLIGQLKSNEKNEEALIRQIDELCKRFDIVTPYSKDYR